MSFDREERQALEALLEGAVPPAPIPEAKILATVDRARRQLRASRRRLVGSVGVSGLLLLVAATYWRWSGVNSDTGLDFAMALDITRGEGGYARGRVQAAAGKLYRNVNQLFLLLHQRGAVPAAMHRAVLAALDSPTPVPITYTHGLEAALARLQAGEELGPEDEANATAAAVAAVSAIAGLRERDPELKPTVDNLLRFIRRAVGTGNR